MRFKGASGLFLEKVSNRARKGLLLAAKAAKRGRLWPLLAVSGSYLDHVRGRFAAALRPRQFSDIPMRFNGASGLRPLNDAK